LWPKFERTDAVHDDDLVLCGTRVFIEADAIRPARGFGLFEQGSLFSKTLKTVLTQNQATAFESLDIAVT